MAYFTKEFQKFLRQLEKNNEREWFKANKKRYEDQLKKPFEAFVQVMIDRLQEKDPEVVITPKDAIFRIYRDTRFSKDKTPYKTHLSAVIAKGGRKDFSSPGMYLQFGAHDARYYSGAYAPSKDQLYKIREAIAANPKKFKSIISNKKFVENFGEIQGEKNKRIPKEFREAAEKQPLIFNKGFYCYKILDEEVILQDDLPNVLMDLYKIVRPLNNFLAEAMNQ